jgi:hypothetical protein
MNNSYETDSTVSHESTCDLNTAYIEESFRFPSQSICTDSSYSSESSSKQLTKTSKSEQKKKSYKVKIPAKCKKVWSHWAKKFKKMKENEETNVVISERIISPELIYSFDSRSSHGQNSYKLNHADLRRRRRGRRQVNFNSEQFAFVGDIFYCYL